MRTLLRNGRGLSAAALLLALAVPAVAQQPTTASSAAGPLAPTMTLSDPMPGVAGVMNTVTVTGATPRVRVYIATGFVAGSTPVPPCPGLTLDIGSADVVGSGVSDASGNLTLTGWVNPHLVGRTVFIQAVDASGCQVSNLVTWTWL